MDEDVQEKKEKSFEEQQIYLLKKQLWYSRISTVFVGILALVLLIASLTMAPKLNLILADLQEITSQLKDEDLRNMINNINELTEVSQEGVAEATDKLNEIDLDALNQAIEDLSNVVSPLARFFGK